MENLLRNYSDTLISLREVQVYAELLHAHGKYYENYTYLLKDPRELAHAKTLWTKSCDGNTWDKFQQTLCRAGTKTQEQGVLFGWQVSRTVDVRDFNNELIVHGVSLVFRRGSSSSSSNRQGAELGDKAVVVEDPCIVVSRDEPWTDEYDRKYDLLDLIC
jgi:hypothetical protein